MTVYYSAGGVVVALLSAVAWLYRRYTGSVTREAGPFFSYLWGNVGDRILAVVSTRAAGHLSARRYASAALRSVPSRLDVPCLQPTQMDIDRTYTRLTMRSGTSETVSDARLLDRDDGSSMLVLGDAGSGKSTLCIKLFRDACLHLYRAPRRSPLPILVQLRHLPWASCPETRAGDWLGSQISDRVAEIEALREGAFVYGTYLKGRGLVVLLDGLDEVPTAHLSRACEAIEQYNHAVLSTGVPFSRVMTTGRRALQSMAPGLVRRSFREVLTIEPLATVDIYSFLENWTYPAGRAWSDESARIFADIQANPSLLETCRNPLVLSMYVARDQLYAERAGGRSTRVPDHRTRFYSEVVDELLHFRREDRGGVEPIGSRERKQREEVLSSLALEHLRDPNQRPNSLEYSDAVRRVREVHGLASDDDAERELERMSLDSGLFTQERRGETIRFMHLTLCEFLAARELHERGESEAERIIDRYVSQGAWHEAGRLTEVMVFLCGMAGRDVRRRLLRRLVDSAPVARASVPLRILLEAQDYGTDVVEDVVTAHRDRYTGDDGPGQVHTGPVRLLLELLNAVHAEAPERSGVPGPADFVQTLFHELSAEPSLFSALFLDLLAVAPEDAMARRDRLPHLAPLTPSGLLPVLQEPRVVEFAVGQVRSERPGWEDWVLALAEAGLRHRLVATLLAQKPAEAPTRDASARTWSDHGPVAGTFYGNVLDRALERVGDDPDLHQLSVLARYSRALLDSEGDLHDVVNLSEVAPFSPHDDVDAVLFSQQGRCDLWAREDADVATPLRVTTTGQRMDVFLGNGGRWGMISESGLERTVTRLLLDDREMHLRPCTVDYRQVRGWMRWKRKEVYSVRAA